MTVVFGPGPIVRYVDQTKASVWIELGLPGAVLLRVRPVKKSSKREIRSIKSHKVDTTTVGGHHFALPYVTGLQPGTWYRYEIEYASIRKPSDPWPKDARALRRHDNYEKYSFHSFRYGDHGPMFRTFPRGKETSRIVVGSCRKWGGGYYSKKGEDALELFDDWLADRESERITEWPTINLMIGDQIYADDVAPAIRRNLNDRRRKKREQGEQMPVVPTSLSEVKRSKKPGGTGGFHALSFDDFAYLYSVAWKNYRVARVLANIPTFMMFDDHEVTDDWNLTGGWFKQMLNTPGWLEVLVDGLVAYWMFQGWGNLDPTTSVDDPRVKIIRQAAESHTDALKPLRHLIVNKMEADPASRLPWHYTVPSSPPIHVLDTRNDRNLLMDVRDPNTGVELHATKMERIISEEQLDHWYGHLKKLKEPAFVVTGGPLLMPWLLQLAMAMATRPFTKYLGEVHNITQQNQDMLEYVRRWKDTEVFAAFPRSLLDLGYLMKKWRDETRRDHTLIWLGGDVHFSFVMSGRFGELDGVKHRQKMPYFVQIASSPLRNALDDGDISDLLAVLERSPSEEIEARNSAGDQELALELSRLKDTEAGKKRKSADGFAGPDFAHITYEGKASGNIREGVLFGNTITTIKVSADRREMNAEFWNASPGDKHLKLVATHFENLR